MRFRWLVGGVLLLIGGYAAFWFMLAAKVEDKVLAFIEQKRAMGTDVFYDDLTIEGFPYQIALKVSALKIYMAASEGLDIEIPDISFVVQPWNLTHAMIVTDFIDLDYGQGTFRMAFDDFRASLITDREFRVERISLFSQKLRWQYGSSPKISEAHRANLHLRRPEGGQLESIDLPVLGEFLLTAHQITAPELPLGIFGKTADSFRLESALHARHLPDYSLDSLSQWRDQGGTVAVRSFEVVSGKISLELDGDVTLDQDFKPLGAFSARIRGIDHIISILSQHGAFLHEPGNELLDELKQMGEIQKDGQHKGEKILPLSISLQNGLLILGPIPIYELPAVIEQEP